MKLLSVYLLCFLWIGNLKAQPEQENIILPLETLKQVSKVGEKYVEKEVKKALIGIKQMKTTMEESEEIHKSLMLSLKKSSQKKEEVLQRARDVEQRLEKEEDTCQASLQSAWEDCKPCLEDACKTFYTTTCRRGFSIFTSRIKDFFSRMTPLFFTPHEGKDIRVNEDTEPKDTDITEIEDAFSHLMVDVTSTFDESVQLFKTLQQEFDQSFQKAFTSNMQPIRSSPNADSLESPFGGSGFFKDLGLTNLFQSLIDLSSILFDSFSAAIINTFDVVQNISTDTMKQHGDSHHGGIFSHLLLSRNENLCRDIRRNASGCLQLQEKCQSCHPLFSQECPNLLEVRVEFTEASHLVDASNEEYQQVLQVVQRHTADIADQMQHMKEAFGWLMELSNMTLGHQNMFRVDMIKSPSLAGNVTNSSEIIVEVSLLNSPTISFAVPAAMTWNVPKLADFVSEKAFELYKRNFGYKSQ
ncbi:clusterin-like protein 1 [Callorhinchus milii]|uniref:clusterin-like protein 1 n=1 Tax=Callorhinchus milii TaxID=7868 RepID=UPI000457593A|nr:clusterin-like protein 1 [Callorhinchus milii]|eukprot:gi/632965988/ref/XP_007899164.1/ PREDICTED: clusterin-like protein 1 [Callorhinchus milii]